MQVVHCKFFPNEIWRTVFTNLNVPGQGLCQLVCTVWHKIIEEANKPLSKNDFWASQLLPELAALPESFISTLGGMHAIYLLPDYDSSSHKSDVSIMRTKLGDRAGILMKIFIKNYIVQGVSWHENLILNTNKDKFPILHNHNNTSLLKTFFSSLGLEESCESHNAIVLSEQHYPLMQQLLKSQDAIIQLDNETLSLCLLSKIVQDLLLQYNMDSKETLIQKVVSGDLQMDETKFILLCRFADIEAKNSKGNTVLHEAIEGGKIDLVEQMIISGADCNIPNEQGRTAKDLLIERNLGDLVYLV